MNENQLINANRELWNKRTDAHLASEFYGVEEFVAGKSSLNRFELDLTGDVNGKSLLHLQCHFGQDTLSFARMGARVTGVDFSDTAIAAAKQLAERISMPAEFVCCNVYDTRQHVNERFDLVFTSYGTIGWLPDLKPWAQVVADSLKPGGKFVMCDFHPFVWMLDEEYTNIHYSYFNHETITTDTTGSYASPKDLHPPMKEHGWNHPFSELFTALLNAGLLMEIMCEYDGSPYNCFPGMEKHADGLYRFAKWQNRFPLVYGVRFRKA